MNKVQDFLAEIRDANGLKNAILYGITVSKRDRTAEFSIVTDKAYTEREAHLAEIIAQKYLPEGLRAKIKMIKRVPDAESLKGKIYDFVRMKFPAAAAFLDESHIGVEMLSSGAQFYFDIASGEQSLFTSANILDSVSAYLQSVYCGSFYGNVRIVEKQENREALLEEMPDTEEVEIVEIRRFPITEFVKLDGVDELPRTAVYIADHLKMEGGYSVCGAITYIEEKFYVKHNEKTGEDVEKSRFSITLSDGTGGLRTTYFPKKATLEKVRALKVGDTIVVGGENEEYNGHLSFKASKINYGMPPKDFVPVPKKSKPVPKFYHAVQPQPYVDFEQVGLFDCLEKPSDLKDNVFVVFDLETTGWNNNPAMGRMDKIIEIGAVKMIGGEIAERFSSFVACGERLSERITELTGIVDEDLVDAPPIERVIADFYKFADGAILVGHNVSFDYRFVDYYGEQNGYHFHQKQLDTLTLAQELLRGRLANYKLDTVAAHYGFTFRHHRAFDDALVTAKVFTELIKQRGKLPI